ncbi:MAG: AzlC family ABC transporter permease [Marinibacterium sp.]|nr:AzlC family ABC transporter permease [Marinibacterium sp.]
MGATTPISSFGAGARDSLPFILVAGPFGLLFGVLGTEAGLNVAEVLGFSLAVFAGAAQFTALQLLQENTPTVIVLISALAVNLRVAMYSAALTPYLGGAPLWQRAIAAYFIVDQSAALSTVKFETEPQMPLAHRVAYFFGTSALIAPLWYAMSWLGAVAGSRLPLDSGLDFALPIAFLAMIGPALRTPAHRVAALVAAGTALAAAGLPFNLGLIVAGLAGMMAGAQAELWFERRKAAAG